LRSPAVSSSASWDSIAVISEINEYRDQPKQSAFWGHSYFVDDQNLDKDPATTRLLNFFMKEVEKVCRYATPQVKDLFQEEIYLKR
jgi:hypothetical protein